MNYKIITEDGREREFDEESDWEYMMDLLDDDNVEYDAFENGNGADQDEAEPDTEASDTDQQATDEGEKETDTVEVVAEEDTTTPPQPTEDDISGKPSVKEDPVDWLPDHFIDRIKGVPTVNRKGYAVIASKYGVEVTAEPIVRASETGFEYAEFRAIATTDDGTEYSGMGSAHVNRDTGDSPYLLNELAETRAMKRAVAWATGVGLTAVEELQGEQ